MTSHSPASSPELPKLPSGMRASAHASDLIVFHAFDMEAHGRACYEAGSAAAAQAAWQPIAEAPKDGTNVLLVNRRSNIAAGLWQGEGESMGWWLRGGNGPNTFFNDHFGPTHWMPLPSAPTATPQEPAPQKKFLERLAALAKDPEHRASMAAQRLEDDQAIAHAPSAAPHQGADALREDAERYRWLRDKPTLEANVFIAVITPLHTIGSEIPAAEVDAAIDAARAELAHHQAPQQGEQQ